jgi:hypothetical protein
MSAPRDDYMTLLASIKSLEMIVRGLFTKWAEEANDPRGSAKRMIDGVIASIDQTQQTGSEFEIETLQLIKENLRHFGDQIDVRLRGLGHER